MKFTLVNDTVRERACQAVMSAEDGNVVEIYESKLSASSAQSRLKWMWMTDIADFTGEMKEEVNHRYKKMFLVPILEEEDEDYATMINSIRDVYRIDSKKGEEIYNHVVRETRTDRASVKGMTAYLNEVERDAIQCGIALRHPADLYQLAMR